MKRRIPSAVAVLGAAEPWESGRKRISLAVATEDYDKSDTIITMTTGALLAAVALEFGKAG